MLNSVIDMISRRLSPARLAMAYRALPPGISRGLALHRFRQTVRYAAKHSPFYRKAFADYGIAAQQVRTPQDLKDFHTTPEDLVERPTEFICRPPSIVFESSGTSGRNKRVYYGQDELVEMGVSMAAGFHLMGLTPEDRVANAFDFSIWIPGLITHYGLMAANNFCLAFGKVDPVEVYRRMELHRFTVVMGEPTWLIRLTELAEQHGSYPLKMLVGGAEEMPARAIPWMKQVWQGAKVKMCYGSVEQGSAIGFQPCDWPDGYHVDNFDFLPEIIEPDDQGWGEMVFTTLMRRVMPLIRYRTRDVTRFETTPCACGITAPRIARLRGRRDELVVASGGNLYPKMFENMLRPVSGLTHDWQVVFLLEGIREVLEIHVETQRTDAAALRREIFAQASGQYPDLMKNLALGIFEMRVETHAPGEIRKTRKLKRMIDRRHFQPAAPIEEPETAAIA
ncbi:MAG: phenylacetate--CoA ligase family protein [Tepidisphaerales bacterium]